MVTHTTPDWDALAPYWHCFETSGLNKQILSSILTSLIPPVLYVGGGRGIYPAHLKQCLGNDNVSVVDSSPAMAKRAMADFDLEYCVADVRTLPYSSNVFATVLCATGILEYMGSPDRTSAFEEMARVCNNGGLILIMVPTLLVRVKDNENFRRPNGQLGSDNHRLLEIWYQHYDTLPHSEKRVMSSYNAVAREIGDRVAAYNLLRNSLPPSNKIIEFNDFVKSIKAADVSTQSVQLLHDHGIYVWKIIHRGA